MEVTADQVAMVRRLGGGGQLQSGDLGQRMDVVLLQDRGDVLLGREQARHRIDVEEGHDRPVDALVGCLVGAHLHRVPAPLVVLHVALPHRHGLNDLAKES